MTEVNFNKIITTSSLIVKGVPRVIKSAVLWLRDDLGRIIDGQRSVWQQIYLGVLLFISCFTAIILIVIAFSTPPSPLSFYVKSVVYLLFADLLCIAILSAGNKVNDHLKWLQLQLKLGNTDSGS